jgi:murein DD-endopeptidase MepM/ murein hydrolase activator NlpD
MATITILPSPAASTTATAIPSQPLCSPLAGYELEDLPGIVSNPFDPPAPGSDNPHQGVDLADRLPGSQASLTGREVQAVLAGRVAGLILDRFPYGNAVMVEVALSKLRSSDLDALALPTPLPQPLVNPALTCPPIDLPYPETPNRALYILYAHLADPPRLQIGQVVQCGEPLGSVGDSGNALNPHLHLEVRIGPAEARFTSLGHYANNLTADEMGLYCLWRVSGTFQVIDPLKLLALKP